MFQVAERKIFDSSGATTAGVGASLSIFAVLLFARRRAAQKNNN
jgi:hypothetical protein